MKSLSFYIPEAWKRNPFRAEPPRIGHYREYPPPLPSIQQIIEATACQRNWDQDVLSMNSIKNSSFFPLLLYWFCSCLSKYISKVGDDEDISFRAILVYQYTWTNTKVSKSSKKYHLTSKWNAIKGNKLPSVSTRERASRARSMS